MVDDHAVLGDRSALMQQFFLRRLEYCRHGDYNRIHIIRKFVRYKISQFFATVDKSFCHSDPNFATVDSSFCDSDLCSAGRKVSTKATV